MTKDEIKREAKSYAQRKFDNKEQEYLHCIIAQTYYDGAEPREKRIAELEAQISILLSCKNCTENKGGLLCQKEYEDKCLAQKIQYIKELKEEIAELEKCNGKLVGQATEIIRGFYNAFDKFDYTRDLRPLIAKAKSFLKE